MSNFRSYRMDKFPPVVKILIAANVLVFILQLTLENTLNFTDRVMLYPVMPEQLYNMLVAAGKISEDFKFQPYQLFTHLFAHSPGMLFHIVFNMFALWMFGRVLENQWGSQRFLFFYLICGLGAALCHLLIQYFRCEQVLEQILAGYVNNEAIGRAISPALGASGAVMGVLAAFAYLFPNTELYLMFIPIPIKAKWAVLGLAAFDLFGGIAGRDNIAHFAHLGGALTGFILVLLWRRDRSRFY